MLDEIPLGDPPVEVLATEEVVVDAVLLAGAWPACRRRDRQLQLRQALPQAPDQGPLADPGGPGDDKHTRHGQSTLVSGAEESRERVLVMQQRDQLRALALGEAADRLA